MKQQGKDFERLVQIVSELRAKCPWDREQTTLTLQKTMLSEAKELAEAIRLDDAEELKGELGDLLLNVLMITEICRERKLFDVSDVLDGVIRKMTRRHPHVYGNAKANTAEEALHLFHEAKRQEKREKQAAALLQKGR